MRSLSRKAWYVPVIAAAVVAGLLAGCGSAAYRGALTASRQRLLSPVPGSRALAIACARRILDSLILPAGSRQLPARSTLAGLDQPGVSFLGPGNLVDLHRLYRLPATVPDAITFLRTQLPPGTVASSASGGGTTASGVTSTAIAVTQQRVLAGLDQVHLVETLAPGPGRSSLLRADAQVVWYPPRSAAEYLVAARFRAVRITATNSTGAATVTGGPRVIGPLVAVVDSMNATPPLHYPCPFGAATYTLSFAPAVPAQRVVVVESGPCNADSVLVGGQSQPDLFDPGRLGELVARLVRESTPAGRSRQAAAVIPLP